MRPGPVCIAIGIVLLLVACGGSGTSASPPPPPSAPVLLSVDVPLDGLANTPYEIQGLHVPGADGDAFAVRFLSVTGPIFDDCATSEVAGVVTRTSDTTLQGTAPATRVLADAAVLVAVDFPDGNVISTAPIATFLGTPDPVVDQDGNGLRDGCDPQTYDFEQDPPGERPAGVTQLGFPTPLEVAVVDGDRVARYDGSYVGTYDRLDRVQADYPHQDTTVYVDWDATDSVGTIELWSEGSYSDDAGGGLIVQVDNGRIYFFERTWRAVPVVAGPLLPSDGRLRIRVAKGPGSTSTVHVDSWSGAGWNEDYAVFPVANDAFFRGRDTSLASYSHGIRGIKRITVVHEPPPGPLTVLETPEGLMPWKLFQRSADDTATIPVDVVYHLPASGRLEARLVRSDNGLLVPGHDFADHTLALAPGEGVRARLVLVGAPTGGNYDLQVRLLDEAGALVAQEGVADLAVGDVYVCAGQSNMSGYSGALLGATSPLPEVHRFHNDGRWDQAVEPVDDGTDQEDGVSYETPRHSLMLPFGRALYEATGVPVALVPTSLSGTNLHTQWQRNATRPDWRATLYGSMLYRARLAAGDRPPAGLLWFQGESDVGTTDAAGYEALLTQLIQQVRDDFAAPELMVLVAQLGTCSAMDLDQWLEIQEAQRRVARADANVALVTTVDQPLADWIHFSVAGYQGIGWRFAQAARFLRHGYTPDPLTKLVSVATGENPGEIVLIYDAPVHGGEASLFSASDDAGALTVTDVQTSGATVTLTLDRAPSESPTVTYGRSATSTDPWIEDGNGVPVPCFADVPVEAP